MKVPSRKIFLITLSLLIPGWGHATAGCTRRALLFQLFFYIVLFLLTISRFIVTIKGLYLLFFAILFLYAWSCILLINDVNLMSSLKIRKWVIKATLFPTLSISVFLGVFFLKPWIMGVQVYKVKSDSMAPTLTDGDLVMVDTWKYLFSEPAINDIVLFSVTRNGSVTYVKRVSKIPEHINTKEGKYYYLLGDNAGKSLDSRHFGLIDIKNIKGKLKYKLKEII